MATENIIIIGGGLIGIDLARRYRNKIGKDHEINILESRDKLLSGWAHRKIEKYKVDNGFHGIELPRGKYVADMLIELSGGDNYEIIKNERYLMIQDSYLSFTSGIKEWPIKLQQGLTTKLPLSKEFEFLNTNEQMNTLKGSVMRTLCEKVATRYSDNIENCWSLLYPWFYPREFLFRTDDEGSRFQRDVRAGLIQANYLKPKDGLFSDIGDRVEKSLINMGIKIKKEVNIELDKIDEMAQESTNKIIWTASSYSLLKMIEPKLANDCIGGTRHMHLYLFKLNQKELENIRVKIGCIPTEILCLNEKIIGLNRLSFIEPSKNTDQQEQETIIMAEVFSKKKEIDKEIANKIVKSLNAHFKIDCEYIGSTYGRPMLSLKNNALQKARKVVNKYAEGKKIIIPEIYFSPINMSKCAIISQSFVLG